ncbi:FadR/GntR family transcriptional regulator [Cellulomonas cellasea]|uniref:FadR/GntR family transcriptional regulator n=1 Tax=Cellulomonas cellasea TaxID=43670 RepID=UPI0025A4632C|nr:FadR/GntR family transcriptional regulator [Cellulomonas cellasea]MDM8086223.1 FadR/GntR family transcriptional regulator [Cellulomonas cellasea]
MSRPMSRTDEVVDGIKKMILDGRLHPGDRLPVEKDLATELGVSRGSLREGVRALSILGVLDTRQGDGTYVTSLDPERLLAPMGFVVDLHGQSGAESFHAVRRLLETEAAGLAAQHIDAAGLAEARAILDSAAAALREDPLDHERLLEMDIAFHRAIATAAGNPVLAALVESLASRTVRARLWRSRTDEDVARRTHDEHEAVLAALAAGDPDRARLRMAVHLLGVEDFVHGSEPD